MLKDFKVEHISLCDYVSVSIFKLPVLFGCDPPLSLYSPRDMFPGSTNLNKTPGCKLQYLSSLTLPEKLLLRLKIMGLGSV